ncbi:ArsR family transcriptional regulator [Corynebacterium glutamicum SCgG2]|nr:ArsR family transcriptional regulator [Corynebacterium glutamicum SCgG1]AGN22270.1 ArsR family transcriptional regulator [Corynebacterium glutamicum SCgG2]
MSCDTFRHIDTCRYSKYFQYRHSSIYSGFMTTLHTIQLANPTECCTLATGPLSSDESEHDADLFKVLGDPVRLRILSQLAAGGCGPVSVNELTNLMGLSQPTISHHLKKMTEAGFLERVPEGRVVLHRVRPELFAELRTVLQIGSMEL